MGTMDYLIVPGQTRHYLDDGDMSAARREKLKTYAKAMAASARNGQITDLEGFAGTAAFAAAPFLAMPSKISIYDVSEEYCAVYLEDLRRVLIGDGLTRGERNKGKFSLPFGAFRDTGFRERFQDGGNQVQHAMAGIYVSYRYGWLGRRVLNISEDEKADLKLYDATFDIGSDLDGSNFGRLPLMIQSRLG